MYSRSTNRQPSPIRLPEHYGGVAFSDRAKAETADMPPAISPKAPPGVAKPTPPANFCPKAGKSPFSIPEPPGSEPAQSERTPPPVPMPEPLRDLVGSLGNAFPFSHGIGFDEMLILGLILLLARSGQDSDMVLLLGLLLFCG